MTDAGILTVAAITGRAGASISQVKQLKLEILSHAYVEFEAVDLETGTDIAYEFQAFVEDNMGWLPGYTLFRTLLNEYSNNALWHEWIPEHQTLADAEVWLATTAADQAMRTRFATGSSPPTCSGSRGGSGPMCASGPMSTR